MNRLLHQLFLDNRPFIIRKRGGIFKEASESRIIEFAIIAQLNLVQTIWYKDNTGIRIVTGVRIFLSKNL